MLGSQPMTRIEQRQSKVVDEFASLANWEGRYKRIIERGKKAPHLPDDLKTEEAKVRGCQSQVWLHAKLLPNGEVEFTGDSDAMIVKGLVSILLEVYSHATPDEVLKASPEFLKKLGFDSQLSPSRANGLFAMLKQIGYFATAFKALQEMQRR